MVMLVEACLDKWLRKQQRASKTPKNSSKLNHTKNWTMKSKKMQRCKKQRIPPLRAWSPHSIPNHTSIHLYQ